MWNRKSTFDSKSNPSSEKNCIVILQIFFYIWKKRHKNVYFSRGFLEAANVDSFQFELTQCMWCACIAEPAHSVISGRVKRKTSGLILRFWSSALLGKHRPAAVNRDHQTSDVKTALYHMTELAVIKTKHWYRFLTIFTFCGLMCRCPTSLWCKTQSVCEQRKKQYLCCNTM